MTIHACYHPALPKAKPPQMQRKLSLPQDVRVIEAPVFTPKALRQAMVAVDHVIYGVGRPEQFVFDKTVFERVNSAWGSSGYRFKTGLKKMHVSSQDTMQTEFTHDYKTSAIRKRKTFVPPVEKPPAGLLGPGWINPLPAQA